MRGFTHNFEWNAQLNATEEKVPVDTAHSRLSLQPSFPLHLRRRSERGRAVLRASAITHNLHCRSSYPITVPDVE